MSISLFKKFKNEFVLTCIQLTDIVNEVDCGLRKLRMGFRKTLVKSLVDDESDERISRYKGEKKKVTPIKPTPPWNRR
jgi:hypothetical protein